jgi:Rod binding domain-containing protein
MIMNVAPIQSSGDDANVPIEDLAGNKHLTGQQKIHEASQQFEVILLKQILSEMQKPVTTSEFDDDSTAAGIYQDTISNALAQSIAKSGGVGFAKVFEEQLTPRTSTHSHTASTAHPENRVVNNAGTLSAKVHE